MTKRVNMVLAAALLIAVFTIGGVTLFRNYKSMAYAFFVTYRQNAKGERGLQTLKPRIESLNSEINTKLMGKDQFRKLNARFQLALGKQMLSFGGTTMVRLKTGHLYDVQAEASDEQLRPDVDAMVRLSDKLNEQGIPMVFVYAHSELYEEGLLPTGVRDFNNQTADKIVGALRAGGVATIDSRELYREQGFTMQEAAMRTDQHWAIRMAFEAYRAAVTALSETGKVALDEKAIDPANFSIETLPGAHLGDVGARVGADAVAPDDFYWITPKFDTMIRSRVKRSSDQWQEREGTFEEAVLNRDVLDNGALPHNIYDTYGRHTDLAYYTNEAAPQGRLLVIKDSFGTPTASFLSLAAREVCTLDLRRTRVTAEQMIEEFKPDAVLVVHCQEMFRGNKNYVFVD